MLQNGDPGSWVWHLKFNIFISSEEKQKSIDIEIACELLSVVLGYLFRHQVDKLVEYLKVILLGLDTSSDF